MKNLIRRITVALLMLIMATGGMVLSANSRPIPTQHHVDSVAQNHREAWRPTDTANFLDLAVAMELFSNTHYSRGNLEGILFTTIDARQGANRGNPISYHDSPASVVGTINVNPYFHQWLRQNQTELSQIAANFAFADITNPTYYTHALAPLVYFNIFGGRYNAAGERVFDGGANITRNESVVVLERLGVTRSVSIIEDDLFNNTESIPAWADTAWGGIGPMIIRRSMTSEQVRQVTSGSLTRIEAAILINSHFRISANTNIPHYTDLNALRNVASNAFSDLTNITLLNEDVWANNPMYEHQRRTGQAPLMAEDIASILVLADLGIILGFEDGTFRPFDTIRRQDFAIMILRALEAQANQSYYTLTGRTVN